MNYSDYLKVCARENIPVKTRHWAWNMQKPGMLTYRKAFWESKTARTGNYKTRGMSIGSLCVLR